MTLYSFVVAPAWELRERGGQEVSPTGGPKLPARLEQNSEETWKFNARDVAYHYYTWNKILDERRLPRRKQKFALKVRLGSGQYVTVGTFEAPGLYVMWPQFRKEEAAANAKHLKDLKSRP